MKLHNYFRSSTSLRVRIALALKQLPYDYVSHHLRKGEQRTQAYLALNPRGLVPQVINGRRFDCDMAPYPTIQRIHEACMTIPAFAQAAPDRQPDAEA